MRVERVGCTDYRNLTKTEIAPSSGVNILFGDNAQGKTNLLEAIWLFTGAKSFRGARDAELIRFGCEKSALSLSFYSAGRPQQIDLALFEKRSAKLNGISLESPAKLAGEFCAVIFSPEHLGLVKEGPALRRRFIDSAVCQLYPRYAAALLDYKKALAQRNALLKDIPRHAELLDTLDIWDRRLSGIGAGIVFTRLRYLKRLEEEAKRVYGGIARESESLSLVYEMPEQGPFACPLEKPPEAAALLAENLYESLKKARPRDMETGCTGAGPHRDDLAIFINGLSARAYGSQGQQRSVVLALKLAEAAVLKKAMGEAPVLLLDDVMSELDTARQEYLLNHLEESQVFITCCDPSAFAPLAGGAVFEVKSGEISVSQRLHAQ